MKADFARSQCLGGVMVWGISHDTKEAKYSIALGQAAPRLFNSQAATDNSGIVTEVTEHKQCKWTSCSEGCPADWIRMMRKDPGARTNEYMTNEAGCNGVGKQYVSSSPASSFALDPSLSWNNVSIC